MEAGAGKRKRDGDDMEALEAATLEAGTRLPGFVSAGVIQPEKASDDGGTAAEAAAAANPEDIELDEGEEEEDGPVVDAAGVQIEQQAVPDAVFGGLAGTAQQMGALDRFKKRKTDT